MTAGTVYIKELSAPKGYKLDTTVRSLKVEAGKTVTLNVSDVPKVTETLVDLFKILSFSGLNVTAAFISSLICLHK